MNSNTETYLQALLVKLTANLARTIDEQGLRTGRGTLPLLTENVRWLSEADAKEDGRMFRRVLFAPAGCGKTTFALACARAIAKRSLGLPEDDDTTFADELAKRPCMDGILDAGVPVMLNARKSMSGESEPESLLDAINLTAGSALDDNIDARQLGRLLLIVDGIDQIHDEATRSRFLELVQNHLAANDDSLLLLARDIAGDTAKRIYKIPDIQPITLGSLFDTLKSESGGTRLRDFFRIALDEESITDLLLSEFENGTFSNSVRSIDDLIALTEVTRAKRPLPLSRRDLYEEYVDVIQNRALEEGGKDARNGCSIERLAMLCSQAQCAADASKAIVDLGSEKEIEKFCRLNDDCEWEFRSQSLQSFLTTKAIEQGESGMEGSIGVDALLLVRDQQIKCETIEFLSVSIHPDQQVLLIKMLKEDGNAKADLALAYLPKPESAEAANVLYRSRFEDGVFLSDALLLVVAGEIGHRTAIDAFLAQAGIQFSDDFTMIRIVLALQQLRDGADCTFSYCEEADWDDDLHSIVTRWLQTNGATASQRRSVENGNEISFDIDDERPTLQGLAMLPSAANMTELLEALHAVA